MPATNQNSLWTSPLTVTLASLAQDKVLNDGGFYGCRGIEAGAAGNVVVLYKGVDGGADIQDTLQFQFAGQRKPCGPYKILQAGTTAFPICVYY